MNFFNDLPPVLSEEDQNMLFKKLPDKRAREALINGNLRFVSHIAKKFLSTGIPM